MDKFPLKDVLARLGTVKNPVLFSSSTFSVSIMYFSKDLVLAGHLLANITGACMFILAVIIFLIAVCFYIYAYVQLPSSTQELVFLQEAREAIERHKRSSPRSRSKKQSNANT